MSVAVTFLAVLVVEVLARASLILASAAVGVVVAIWVIVVVGSAKGRRRRTARAAAEGRPVWEHDRDWSPQGEVLTPWRRTRPGPARGGGLFMAAGAVAGVDFVRTGLGPVSTTLAAIPVTYLAVALFRAHQQGGLQVRWPSFPIRPGGRTVFHIATTPGGSRLSDTIVALRCHGPLGEFDAWNHYPMTVAYLPADRTPGPDEFVEVAFEIPADAPSNDLHAKRPTRWELVVAGDTPWGEIVEVITVPVYRDPGSAPPGAPPPLDVR